MKRLRGAVEEGLRGGWGGEGLKGALLVVVKGEGALGLKSEDIAGSVRSMLGRVGTAMREAGDEKRAMGSEKGGRGGRDNGARRPRESKDMRRVGT